MRHIVDDTSPINTIFLESKLWVPICILHKFDHNKLHALKMKKSVFYFMAFMQTKDLYFLSKLSLLDSTPVSQ